MKIRISLAVLCLLACIAGTLACRSISSETKKELASPVDCNTAEQDIASLEAEKASVATRVSAGVRSVIPAAAVAGLLRRDTKDRAKVATGAYNKEIDAKIAEIKSTCGLD